MRNIKDYAKYVISVTMDYWKSSITRRYLILALFTAILPLAPILIMYGHYTSQLIETISGERVESLLAVSSNKMKSFLEVKAGQLESIADLPSLTNSEWLNTDFVLDRKTENVIKYEIDDKDFYGAVLFSMNDKIINAFPGQGAYGTPYWQDAVFKLDGLPKVSYSKGIEIIGPYPPSNGNSGWFIMRKFLTSDLEGTNYAGSIGLHLRLASLTEQLSDIPSSARYRSVLHTPENRIFSSIGTVIETENELIKGPEMVSGWYPAVLPMNTNGTVPFAGIRQLFLMLYLGASVLIFWVFLKLSKRMRNEINPLIYAARSIAKGRLSRNINIKGNDEIAQLAFELEEMRQQLSHFISSRISTEKKAVLGEFAACIAHEIRNPLATIKTSAQALNAGETDPKRKEITDIVVEEINRINDVIETLLSYARPMEPEITTFSLDKVISKMLTLFMPMLVQNNISLDTSGDFNLTVSADMGHVHQILTNFILNSIDALEHRGKISVHAETADCYVKITVTDNGSGIKQELIESIATPFFTTKTKGVGLGLSIAYQLANLNKGRIEYESKPEKWTKASLYLPIPSDKDSKT